MADVKKGDRVTLNERYYVPPEDRRRVFEVTSDPFPLPDGVDAVSLAGRPGAYPADGLELVPDEEESREAERSTRV